MQTLKQLASQNGFHNTYVSAEEREDGIGTCVGLNFTKNNVFYTPMQAMQAIGHELKFTSGKIQAANQDEAKAQVLDQLVESGVKAAQITKCYEYTDGEFFVKIEYVK